MHYSYNIFLDKCKRCNVFFKYFSYLSYRKCIMYTVWYTVLHTDNKTIEKVEFSINIYWLIEILLKNRFTPSIILIEIKIFVKLFSQQCRNEGKRHRLSDQPIHVCCHAAPSHNWATSQARLGRHKKCGSQGGGQAVDKTQYIHCHTV